jgi:hypothetical protein
LIHVPIIDCHADDRALQQATRLEPVQRPEGHDLRQIPGDSENHKDIGRLLLLAHSRRHVTQILLMVAAAVLNDLAETSLAPHPQRVNHRNH